MKTLSKLKNPLIFTFLILIALNIAFGFKYKIIYIQGKSMEPTYENKDWLIMEKTSSLGTAWIPDRYDIVLIKEKNNATSLCKRVIGLPGDKIKIQNGYIYLNGNKLIDPFGTSGRVFYEMVDENDKVVQIVYADMKEETVPKNSVWVIGDNRGYSWFGVLPMDNVRGLIVL